MGSDDEKKAALEGLKSAEGYIKSRIAKVINLRNTPVIRFVLDESIEYGIKMTHIIDELSSATNEEE